MFQLDEPDDRSKLIEKLAGAGLEAFEWETDGQAAQVCLVLVDGSTDPAWIQTDEADLKRRLVDLCRREMDALVCITTMSTDSGTAVGLTGEYAEGRAPFAAGEPRLVHTLEEAAAEFIQLWKDRDHWLWQYLKAESA